VFVARPAAFDHGLVDGQIAAADVLEKKGGIPDVIEKLFHRGQGAGGARWLPIVSRRLY
jgi:hypothetical protein